MWSIKTNKNPRTFCGELEQPLFFHPTRLSLLGNVVVFCTTQNYFIFGLNLGGKLIFNNLLKYARIVITVLNNNYIPWKISQATLKTTFICVRVIYMLCSLFFWSSDNRFGHGVKYKLEEFKLRQPSSVIKWYLFQVSKAAFSLRRLYLIIM